MLNGRLLRRKFSATAIDGDGNARQTLWIASKPSTMAVASHRLIHDPIPIMRTATVDGVLSDWKMTEGLSGGSVRGGPSRDRRNCFVKPPPVSGNDERFRGAQRDCLVNR